MAEGNLGIIMSKMCVENQKAGKPLPTKEDVKDRILKVKADIEALGKTTPDVTNAMLAQALAKKSA